MTLQQGRSVNVEEATELIRLYNTDIVVGIRSWIEMMLLNPGLDVVPAEGDKPPSEEFRLFIRKHWRRFASDALDALLCFGYVPYVVVKRKIVDGRKGRPPTVEVPVVLKFGTYDVHMQLDDDMTVSYNFTAKSTMLSKKNPEGPEVYHYVESEPYFHNGNHRSRMAAVYPQLKDMEFLAKYAKIAEHNRAMPAVVMQRRDGRAENQVMVSSGEAHALEENREIMYTRDEDAVIGLERMHEVSRKKRKQATEEAKALQEGEYDVQNKSFLPLADTFYSNVHLLPQQLEVSSKVPVAQSRNNLTVDYKMIVTRVCGVFGVPATLIFNESSARSNNSALDYRVMLDILGGYNQSLMSLFEHVYQTIYGDSAVKVVLRELPDASTERLLELYRHGAISDAYLLEKMGYNAGIPEHMINTKANVKASLRAFATAISGPTARPGAAAVQGQLENRRAGETSEDRMIADGAAEKRTRQG